MKQILITLLIISNLVTKGQENILESNNGIKLNLTEESFEKDGNEYLLFTLDITNTSDSNYIFWISEVKKNTLSQLDLIDEHFLKRKGDLNLIELGTGKFTSNTKLPSSQFAIFTKIIKPKNDFKFSIHSTSLNADSIKSNIERLIENQVILLPTSVTDSLFVIKSLDMILYKPNTFSIDWNVIKDKVIE
jgi:hypothetical protein